MIASFAVLRLQLLNVFVLLAAGLDCIAPLVTGTAAQAAALCITRDDREGCNLQVEEKLISAVTGINNPASPVKLHHSTVVCVFRRWSDLKDLYSHESEGWQSLHLSDAVAAGVHLHCY